MTIKAWLVWKSSNLVTNDFQREHPWLGDFPASHGDETGDTGNFLPIPKICSSFESIIPFCNPFLLFLLVQVSFSRNQDLVNFDPENKPQL